MGLIDPETKLPCMPSEKLYTLFYRFFLRRGAYVEQVSRWRAQGTILVSVDIIDPGNGRQNAANEWRKFTPVEAESENYNFAKFYGEGPGPDFSYGGEVDLISLYEIALNNTGSHSFVQNYTEILTNGSAWGLTTEFLLFYQSLFRWLLCHWFQMEIASTLRNCFCLDNRGRPDMAE